MDLAGLPPWQRRQLEALVSRMNLSREKLDPWQQKVLAWVDDDKGSLLFVNAGPLDRASLLDFLVSSNTATPVGPGNLNSLIESLAAKHVNKSLLETVCIIWPCDDLRDTPVTRLSSQLTAGALNFTIERQGVTLVTHLPIGPKRVIVLTNVAVPKGIDATYIDASSTN